MRIGSIIEAQQPDIYKHNKKKSKDNKNGLSFSECMELMNHNSYKKHRGDVRHK